MLVINLNILPTINFDNFAEKILLKPFQTFCSQKVGWVDCTASELRTRLNRLTLFNFQHGWFSHFVINIALASQNGDGVIFSVLTDMHLTSNLRKDALALRFSCLEDFLNSRQTLCDIRSNRRTTSVEGSHCQLRARLAD